MNDKLTQTAVAEHLGMSQPAVSGWLQRLGLTVDAGLDTIRLAYIEHLRAQAGGQGAEDERRRLLELKRKSAELSYRKQVGELVDAGEVARERFETARQVATALLQIPARVAPVIAPQDPRRADQLLTEEIHRVLEALAADLERAPEAAHTPAPAHEGGKHAEA